MSLADHFGHAALIKSFPAGGQRSFTAADREIGRLMALHPKGFDLSLDRIVPSAELAKRAVAAGLSADPINSVANALERLRDSWNRSEPAPRVLIGGSLYLAGEVLEQNGTPPD